MKAARLLGAVVSAAAATASVMYVSPASAAPCGLSLVNCTGTTPICSLSGVCVGCTTNAECGGLAGLGASYCNAATGACGTCSGDSTSGLTGACPAATPICGTGGTCVQCQAGGEATQCPTKEAPFCTSASLCGCNAQAECSSGLTCVIDAGAAGQCLASCGAPGDCTAPTSVCDTDVDGGLCVECHASSGCDGGATCDEARHVCLAPDAGSAGDGGPGSSSDGGTTPPGGEGGPVGGGSGSADGSVDAGNDAGNDGGDDGGEPEVMYGYGRVEGDGCSVLSGSEASSPLLFGFAGIAGLLVLRRSQRRATRRRPEDR